MKPRLILLVLVAALGAARGRAADPSPESFNDAVQQAAGDFEKQSVQAAKELERTRQRLTAEKAPLLRARQAAEDKLIALEREVTRLETQDQRATDRRRALVKDQESVRRTVSYLNSSARDALKAFEDGLAPGEDQLLVESLRKLQQSLDDGAAGNSPQAAAEVLEFLQQWTRRAAGGYAAPAQAVYSGQNQVQPGVIVFFGPDSYFLPDRDGAPAVLRRQSGAPYPIAYALPEWSRGAAEPLFRGQPGPVMADASRGKALHLQETRGSVWSHIQSGGIMAYVILTTGLLALLLIVQKVRDLTQLRLDPPDTVHALLTGVAAGAWAEAEKKLSGLRATTRELFAAGLRYSHQPKTLLEEHLNSYLHRQQMHFERRLSLLAVIATAAPLMGLLGTVSGMVNTFALITVFGTGNAMKLSAGISEVLVATELGLMVAIPTLVIHGFLSHRIRKNLALLEHYAMEFVIAVDTARAGNTAGAARPLSHEIAP